MMAEVEAWRRSADLPVGEHTDRAIPRARAEDGARQHPDAMTRF
jgi:hypothetical protein